MADPRSRRLMQQSLDQPLSAEATQELRRTLAADPTDEAAYGRLRQVDRLLKTAPHEPAPQTLAARIMARLAEGLTPAAARTSGLALAIALGVVTAALLPLLIGVGQLLLSALTSSGALTGLLSAAAGILAAAANLLAALANGAQSVLTAYPEAPIALTLIPLGALWLLRVRASERRDAAARGDRLRRPSGQAADRPSRRLTDDAD